MKLFLKFGTFFLELAGRAYMKARLSKRCEVVNLARIKNINSVFISEFRLRLGNRTYRNFPMRSHDVMCRRRGKLHETSPADKSFTNSECKPTLKSGFKTAPGCGEFSSCFNRECFHALIHKSIDLRFAQCAIPEANFVNNTIENIIGDGRNPVRLAMDPRWL